MGVFEGILDETAGYDLDCAVDWILQDYPEDFEAFWGIRDANPPEDMDLDDWLEYQRLYALAADIAEAARSMVRPSGVDNDLHVFTSTLAQAAQKKKREIDEILATIKDQVSEQQYWELDRILETFGPSDPRTKHSFFRCALQVHAARDFLGWPAAFAAKMTILVKYLIRSPSNRVRAYLARVAECYIRDMTPEFAVMCRAVLDAFLGELYSDELVRKKIGPKGRVGLDARIQTAYAVGYLDDQLFDAARRIKRSGDDAIHLAPGLQLGADQLLEDTYNVLVRLEQHRPAA
jgi:hypothetical protein